VDLILRRLLRAAMRRGLADNWTWFLLAAAAYVLRRTLSDQGGKVSTYTVAPGEQLIITVRDRDTEPLTDQSQS
jgi:ferric-dicitrate binding protein FerR (iron transport regulator)